MTAQLTGAAFTTALVGTELPSIASPSNEYVPVHEAKAAEKGGCYSNGTVDRVESAVDGRGLPAGSPSEMEADSRETQAPRLFELIVAAGQTLP